MGLSAPYLKDTAFYHKIYLKDPIGRTNMWAQSQTEMMRLPPASSSLGAEEGTLFSALIVEDNAAFRRTLRSLLGERFPTMVIDEAGDAEQALSQIRNRTPDLIFMDIRLPGRSGLELTREISCDYPRPRIVILTSYDLPEYRTAALESGASYFLTKGSVTTEEIAKLVRSISEELGLTF
jgi:CheY-like chemotaxis protein